MVDDDIENDLEQNPGIRTARSERGLKKLSVKVIDLVFKLKETSYKDVANKLIEELVNKAEYDQFGNKIDVKVNSERKTKEEKNVRRRVYDALNVLIACGVLKKNANKNVMYEERPEARLKGLKFVVNKKQYTNKKKALTKQIAKKKNDIKQKRIQVREAYEKLNSFKNLIDRNKAKEASSRHFDKMIEHEIGGKILEDTTNFNKRHLNVIDEDIVEKLHFPLVVLSTPNTSDNQIRL